jgi:hypothetical protein
VLPWDKIPPHLETIGRNHFEFEKSHGATKVLSDGSLSDKLKIPAGDGFLCRKSRKAAILECSCDTRQRTILISGRACGDLKVTFGRTRITNTKGSRNRGSLRAALGLSRNGANPVGVALPPVSSPIWPRQMYQRELFGLLRASKGVRSSSGIDALFWAVGNTNGKRVVCEDWR